MLPVHFPVITYAIDRLPGQCLCVHQSDAVCIFIVIAAGAIIVDSPNQRPSSLTLASTAFGDLSGLICGVRVHGDGRWVDKVPL